MSKTTSSKAPKKHVIGLDIGYSNVKMAYGAPDEEPVTMIRPAQAAPLSHLHSELKDGEYRVEVNGEPWAAFINPGRVRNTRELHADYTSTDAYMALFYAALSACCPEGNVVDKLITGLPVRQSRDPKIVEQLVKRMVGVHQIAAKRSIEVKEVEVLAQPIGTLHDIYSFHDDAELLDESHVLVLDPGFFSVDWVVFNRGDIVVDSSDSALEAMSELIKAINQEIAEEHGGEGPGTDKIEIALQQGKETVLLYGERLELAPYIDRASAKVAPAALNAMKQQMRFMEEKALDFILLGGGGTNYYRAAAQKIFPKAKVITAQKPVISNACGFFYAAAGSV